MPRELIPIPMHVKVGVWDYVRPYKDNRYFFADFPGVPRVVKSIWRGSFDLEAIVTFVLGPDPEPNGEL